MYYADSDILTVIIAMITLAAGVYSSVAKKKKSALNGKGSENDLSGEEDKKGILEKIFVTEEEIDEEAELFDYIFGTGKKKDAEEEIEEPLDQIEELYEGEKSVSVMQQDELESAEDEFSEAFERIRVEEESNENQLEGLKERVKKSPKDMILFAEILKPKFKEF